MSAAAEMGYTTPHQARSLRACMVCSIILQQSRFTSSGCPNCEAILQLAGNPDAVNDCTSSNFNGMIALMSPTASWIAKWQRLESYAPGMYAVQVVGTLPEEVIQSLEDAGIRFVPRDGTKEEEQTAEA